MYLKKLTALGCCQAFCRAYLSYVVFSIASRLPSRRFYTLCSSPGLSGAVSQWVGQEIPTPETVPR